MVNRLKNALWLIVGAVVAVWAVTSLVGLVQAGPMDPPGPPTGGTMKPLDQIDPRTAIVQPGAGDFPIVISQPGSYYLVENITGVADKDGIEIAADNVTLDLNGFTLQGATGSWNGIAVVGDTRTNISIYNGTIRGWGGDGICGGPPCQHGDNTHVRDVTLSGNGGAGLRLYDEAVVTAVEAVSNTAHGIIVNGGVVSESRAYMNDADGVNIFAGTVSGCEVAGNQNDGIELTGPVTVVGNRVDSNAQVAGGRGIRVSVLGFGSHIEGNDVVGNVLGPGIDTSASILGFNVIIKNTASANGGGNYVTNLTDTVGPIIGPQNPIASNNPWANISY